MQESTPSGGVRLVKTKTPGIYKKGNRYVVVFRDTTGKQRKRFAHTLVEARTVKAALTADVKRGDYFEESKVAFDDYAKQWLDTYGGRTSKGIREVTRKQYRHAIETKAIPFFGSMPMSSLRPTDMKSYAQRVASTGVSANTVRLALAPVRALLATAVEDGLIRSNPAAGLRLSHTTIKPHVDEVEKVKALSEDELRALLAEVPEEHLLLVEFIAQTGVRVSEALGLRKGDIDFGRRRVKIRRRLYDGEIAPPKTRHGRRDVPISTGMAQKLCEESWR